MNENLMISTLSNNYKTVLRQVPGISVKDFIDGIKKIGEITLKDEEIHKSGFFDDHILKQLYGLHKENKKSIFPTITKDMPFPEQQAIIINKSKACDAFVAVVDDWQNKKLLSFDSADQIMNKLETAGASYENSAHLSSVQHGYSRPEIFRSFPVSLEPKDLFADDPFDNAENGIVTSITYDRECDLPKVLKEKSKEISDYISELSGIDEPVFLCVGEEYVLDDKLSACVVVSQGSATQFDIGIAISDAMPSGVDAVFAQYPASNAQIETAREIAAKEDTSIHFDVAKDESVQQLNEQLVSEQKTNEMEKGFGD